jgi:threonine aldolase
MIRFENDYTRGTHPRILKRLVETNELQTSGYGTDDFCEKAAKLIKHECDHPNIDVHFLMAGTQTNLTVITAILRPHEAVIAPSTGHIATAETGAIEATGHKVITIPTDTGKITAEQILSIVASPENIHAPKPGMIFISQSTEFGGVYTKSELLEIKTVANEFDLPLFIDGARLGYAFASEECDVTLADMAEICDVFYIGGTKVGALFGEAVVIVNDKLKHDFRYIMKQRGGLLAKGRLLGVQFEEFFKDGLYYECGQYAVKMAMRVKEALIEVGIPLKYPVTTNQLFIEFTDEQFTKLSRKYVLAPWIKGENTIVARICIDWSTLEEHIDQLIEDLKTL